MASEEDKSAPTTLPPYPELILTAIKALDDKDGSTKAAISKHIESQHADLPAGHATLLAHHLSKMKANGELVLANDTYKLPDPNTPAKRGRGRPPKPKTPGSEAPPSTPKPRGRPPKPKDPEEVAAKKAASGTPKRRGRPPKKAGEGGASAEKPKPKPKAAKAAKPAKAAKTAAAASPASGAKRGRGRPPKAKPEAAATAVGSD